jgi:hypothetical protein
MSYRDPNKKYICACCEAEKPPEAIVASPEGDMCLFCLGEMYYDGLSRRQKALSFKETKKKRLIK